MTTTTTTGPHSDSSPARRRRPRAWVLVHSFALSASCGAGLAYFVMWAVTGHHHDLSNAGLWLFFIVFTAAAVIDGYWGRSTLYRSRLEEQVAAVEDKVDVMGGAMFEVRDALADKVQAKHPELKLIVNDDHGA